MRHQRQSVFRRERENVAKPPARTVHFIAADSEADDAVHACGLPRAPRHAWPLRAELPDRIEDPPDLDGGAAASAQIASKMRAEVLLLPENHADRQVDLRVDDVLRRKPLQQPPRDQSRSARDFATAG